MSIRGVTGWQPARLRSARTEAGLTQSALAARLDLATWTIWAWEQPVDRPSARAPTVRHLAALAEVLGVDPVELAPLPAGATLRDLRQRAGLTTTQMGAEVGVSDTAVTAVEHGRWWPSSAARWSELLGVDMETFRAAWETGRN